MKLWEKILLKFRPVYIGVDPAVRNDYSAMVYGKELHGKYHVIRVKLMDRVKPMK